MALKITGNFFFKLINQSRNLGPGPYQTHITQQNIEYLRQFIQTGFPDKTPQRRYPGIILGGKSDRFRAFRHRTKFEHKKVFSVTADPFLTKKHWARR